MEEITRGYIDTNNCQLHYYKSGDGQPILLLHPTPNSQFFLKTMPFLSDKYQVISIDTPGYGNSTRPKVPFSSLEKEGIAMSVSSSAMALAVFIG